MKETLAKLVEAHPERFGPYPEYRDSGVEWLGKIPAHWEVKRLKYLASVRPSGVDKKAEEGEIPVRLCNYTDVYKHERITASMNFMEATATENEIMFHRLQEGDVIVTKDSEEWTDIAVPALVVEPLENVLCGYHLALLRPDPNVVEGEYLRYSFASLRLSHQFRIAATGITRYGLSADALSSALFLVPPREEQHTIAAFLNRETAKLDTLAGRKERLIELLQEKRQALITQAVTKGLDPSVPMKDAGVEWLEEIPTHWEVATVKRLFRQAKRQGHSELTVLSVYRDYGVIERSSRDDNFNRTPEDLDSYQLVNVGDLVINKMKAWQGSLGISSSTGITSPDYVVYSPHHSENGRFLHHFLRNKLLANVYLTMSNGIRPSQWRLEPDRFENLKVFIPPPPEQVQIATLLDRETARTDALVVKVRDAIDRLKEYRTALISAAVTGKIDVRGEAA